jgi:hypothetical protein
VLPGDVTIARMPELSLLDQKSTRLEHLHLLPRLRSAHQRAGRLSAAQGPLPGLRRLLRGDRAGEETRRGCTGPEAAGEKWFAAGREAAGQEHFSAFQQTAGKSHGAAG